MELQVDFSKVTPDGHITGTPVNDVVLDVGDWVVAGDSEGNRCSGVVVSAGERITIDLHYESWRGAGETPVESDPSVN